ncbi:hypothetical protein [Bacillus toyonensis]
MNQLAESTNPRSEIVLPSGKQDDQAGQGKHRHSTHKLAVVKPLDSTKVSYEDGDIKEVFKSQREVLEQIAEIREVLTSIIEAAANPYSQDEGGRNVDQEKLLEKLSEINTKVGILEERTKKFEMMPTKDEMKLLISQSLQENLKDIPKQNDVKVIIEGAVQDKGLAKKDDVQLMVEKAKNNIILTIITVAGLLFTAIKFFLK